MQMPKEEPYPCDVCGTDMRDPKTGEVTSAISFFFRAKGSKEARRAIKAFGKPQWDICFVCFLKALGVKEVGS